MKKQDKFTKVSELLLDVLSEETECEREMISYLGYTVTMLMNISFCKEHRYEAVLDFIKCMMVTIDRGESECLIETKEEGIKK